MARELETREKILPRSIEAEMSVLGALMLDKNAILKIVDFLRVDDFYDPRHKKIYQSFLELFENNEEIDFLSVSNRLKENNHLEEIGGNSYLTELVNCVPTPAHILTYAQIVQKKRILRDLIDASHKIEELGYNETEDVNKILDEAEKTVFSIAQKNFTQKFIHIKETLTEAYERIEKLAEGKTGLRGIPTGFRELDNILAGFQKSDLVVLAARPSLGKSALAVTLAANAAINHRIPVGIFSLEMSKDQVIDRLISLVSGIDLWRLRTGKIKSGGGENDFEKIQEALSVLSQAPIYIDDAPNPNVLQMKAMCRRLQVEKGLGLIVVDYLQLVEPLNPTNSPVQQVSENSKMLKALARELNVPVLVISQLSRAVEHRSPPIPKLADLRLSGSIEQDADVVMFIYREEKYLSETSRRGIADIIVAKQRNGPTGRVQLFFDERTVSFKSLAPEFLAKEI